MKIASLGTSAFSKGFTNLTTSRKRTQGVTLLVLTLLCLSSPAQAKKREFDWFNLSGFYSQYGRAGGADIPHPAPSADIDLAIRLYSKLSLAGTISNTVEPDPTDVSVAQYRIRTVGGGLKFDLPGFFLIGGEARELKRSAKNWPINSFIMAEVLTLTFFDVSNFVETPYTAGRYALGFDIFPWSELSHFSFKFSYLSFANAGFLVYSFGGGISF